MKSRWLIPIALGIIFSAWPAFAHHGSAVSYDQKRAIKIEGTVTEFLWRNPHSSLYLDGKDDSGKPVQFSIEMGSPGQLVKSGFTRDVFKPGDQVVVQVHPSFVNPTSGQMVSARATVNGKQVGNPEPPASGQAEQ